MIDSVKMVISLIGGLALFIFGMEIMAEGLQKIAGEKLRTLLSKLTANKFLAIGVGAAVTAIIQSSSATTVMVVGFVNAGIMTLTQSVGVIMGANIGTTITSWLISISDWMTFLKPTTIAPMATAVGVVIRLSTKSNKLKQFGEILIGFGLLFLGIESMSNSMEPLHDNPLFTQIMTEFGSNPVLGILAGAVITMLVQSSSASMGILLSIVIAGIVPWSAAVYIILGQNIGTCITALLSSIGATRTAKAASYIHLLFNIIGSLVFAIFAFIFFKIRPEIASSYISQLGVSIFHTAFNISATIMLIPFSNQLVSLAIKMAGITKEDAERDDVIKLDDRLLETPEIAIETTFYEIERLGSLAIDALTKASRGILEKDMESARSVALIEDEIDLMDESLADFLTKILRKQELSLSGNNNVSRYFHIINDMERIGDHSMNISETALYLSEANVSFSKGAYSELAQLTETTLNCLNSAIVSLKENNLQMAEDACRLEEIIDDFTLDVKNKHIERLGKSECDIKSGIAFLDLISNLERISDHARNIAESISRFTEEEVN
ncbi:MAG: Na/Pi cotransporter family protein [Lachnospirales bacterium]